MRTNQAIMIAGGACIVTAAVIGGIDLFGHHKIYYPPAPLPVHQSMKIKSQKTAHKTLQTTSVYNPSLASMHLYFSAIQASAPLYPEAIQHYALEIPSDVHNVGWWSGGGSLTGATGTVLLAGHVNYVGQGPGALSQLASARVGETVITVGANHMEQTWKVYKVTSVPQANLPQNIFAPSGQRRLVIVTCGGTLEPDHYYNQNVLVYATPAATGAVG